MNNKPLLELVDKLMSDEVKSPISAICFEISGINELKVFTIRTVKDQHEVESFKNNEVDLTLTKFSVPKQRTKVTSSTLSQVNEFVKPEKESQIPTIAEIVSQTQQAVLINELVRTKYLFHSDFMFNEYEKEFLPKFASEDKTLFFGYMGIHPYTRKIQATENGTKLYVSIYWGIKQFSLLDPDVDKIPMSAIPM